MCRSLENAQAEGASSPEGRHTHSQLARTIDAMNISSQICYLSDKDLSLLYLETRKILAKRDLLKKINKAIILGELSIIDDSLRPSVVINRPTKTKRQFNSKNESMLFDFLQEDWAYLFTNKYDSERKYYVYYHTDPRYKESIFTNGDNQITFAGKPFYIGKGTGNRFCSKRRSRSHLSSLNELELTYEKDEIYHIFEDNLTEIEALELESKLINFFGCSAELSPDNTHFHGYKGGWLVNSDPALRPDYVNGMISLKCSRNEPRRIKQRAQCPLKK